MKFIEFQMEMIKMIVFFPPFAEKKVIFGKWEKRLPPGKAMINSSISTYCVALMIFVFFFVLSFCWCGNSLFSRIIWFLFSIFIIKLTNFNGFFGCFSVVLCSLKLIIFDLSKIKIHFMAFSRHRFQIYIRIYENLFVSSFDKKNLFSFSERIVKQCRRLWIRAKQKRVAWNKLINILFSGVARNSYYETSS